MLQPIYVDPEDKSWGAWFTKGRNAALHGMSIDVHDVSWRLVVGRWGFSLPLFNDWTLSGAS
jgi:hypothetical protein